MGMFTAALLQGLGRAGSGLVSDLQERDALKYQRGLMEQKLSLEAEDRKRRIDAEEELKRMRREADARARAEFEVKMADDGYEFTAPPSYEDMNLPNPLASVPGGDLIAQGMSKVGMQPPEKRWMKTQESKAEREARVARESLDKLAEKLNVPLGSPREVIIDALKNRNDPNKRQYDPQRGQIVDITTGTAQSVKGLGAKIVDPVAAATRAASNQARQGQQDIRNSDKLKSQYDANPVVKNAMALAPIAASITAALEDDTPTSQVGALYELVKLFDPTSVVRDSELNLVINKGASLDQRLRTLIQQWNSGKIMRPSMKAEIYSLLEKKLAANENLVKPIQARFGAMARQRGVEADSAFIAPSPFEGVPRNPFHR